MNDQPLIKLHTLEDPDPQPVELTQEQLDEQTAGDE
jgi:hypothetical protein